MTLRKKPHINAGVRLWLVTVPRAIAEALDLWFLGWKIRDAIED